VDRNWPAPFVIAIPAKAEIRRFVVSRRAAKRQIGG
jgi:hypothetical protein